LAFESNKTLTLADIITNPVVDSHVCKVTADHSRSKSVSVNSQQSVCRGEFSQPVPTPQSTVPIHQPVMTRVLACDTDSLGNWLKQPVRRRRGPVPCFILHASVRLGQSGHGPLDH